jgi:M-phase inducer tyrosine phosphatase
MQSHFFRPDYVLGKRIKRDYPISPSPSGQLSFSISDDSDIDMSFFNAAAASASRLLKVPPAPTRKRTQHTHDPQLQEQKDEMDNFLSSDLEISFASTMSISSPHRDASLPPSDMPDAMDISPMPPMRTRVPANTTNENADLSSGSATFNKSASRARASTVSRTFGNDVSNDSLTLGPLSSATAKFSDKTTGSTAKRTQRSTLPFEWMSASKPAPAEFEDVNPMVRRHHQTLYLCTGG